MIALFFVSLSCTKKKKIEKIEDANKVFFEILNSEKANGMILDAYEGATKEFNSRYPNIDWSSYCNSKPFEYCCNELYNWSPIADELKKLDKKIVINSMFLKWNNVQNEFMRLTNKFNNT